MTRHAVIVVILLATIVAPAHAGGQQPAAGEEQGALTLYFYRDGQDGAARRACHIVEHGLFHVSVRVAGRALCPSVDGITVALSGTVTRSLQADGSGWMGTVDLPPGDYTLSVVGKSVPLTVTPGQVTVETVAMPICTPHGVYLPLAVK